MFQKDLSYLVNKEFKNVFIVDNRDSWVSCLPLFSKETDIVFCLDFGLKHDLESKGVTVFFLDHFADSNVLQEANYQMHKFLDEWCKDRKGNFPVSFKTVNICFSCVYKCTLLIFPENCRNERFGGRFSVQCF